MAAPGLCSCTQVFPSRGEPELLSSCSTQASRGSEFSCRGTWALGAQASVVVACRLSCPEKCRIFLDQELNLCPLCWQVDFQPLNLQRSSDNFFLTGFFFFFWCNSIVRNYSGLLNSMNMNYVNPLKHRIFSINASSSTKHSLQLVESVSA